MTDTLTPAEHRSAARIADASERIAAIRAKLPPPKIRRRASVSGAFLTERESMAFAREVSAEFRARFLYCPIDCKEAKCPRCTVVTEQVS